jgi:hypothetical protein
MYEGFVPAISERGMTVSLLTDLLDERSQKSCRDNSQHKPQELVVNYR